MAIEKSLGPGGPAGFVPEMLDEAEDAVLVDVMTEHPEAIEIELENGDVEIDFGDEEDAPVGHWDNLAEHIKETQLTTIASDLLTQFEADKRSRADWERAYQKGLKLLGLKIEERTEPWEGACGVFHPLLTESIVRFQSHAITETFPPGGPVKAKIVGRSSTDVALQSQRVVEDMNFIMTEQMEDYRSEHERMLFNLPLSGSAFKKCWFDPIRKIPSAMFVPADDLVVTYGATSLSTCPRFTHMLRMHENDVLKLQKAGFYSDVELSDTMPEYSDSDREEDRLVGVVDTVEQDDRHLILEMHLDINLEDTQFEDPDGIARPHVVSFMKDGKVLSIRRNWAEDDDTFAKRMWFSHYCYLPGLGFYGIGLIHLIGGITKSATSILRQLVDAGTLANLPGGFKTTQFRVKGEDSPIAPGEFRDVDVPNDKIRDGVMPLPYKEPSVVLAQLLGSLTEEGRRLGSIAEMDIGSAGKDMPVGTTLALIERSLKVMSAVQARLHASLKAEMKILARIIKEDMPEEYPFDPDGEFNRTDDYSSKVDVIPVSDPNATTQAQKVIQYQAAIQTAQLAPNLYNMAKLHRDMMEALQIKDPSEVVPIEEDMLPLDPVSENMMILRQEPVKAFIHQDHEAHIQTHMAAAQDPAILEIVGQSPMASAIQSSMAAHITEHVAYAYRSRMEQVLGTNLPPDGDNLPAEVEAQLSPLIAKAARKLLQKDLQEAQAKKIAEQNDDPILQLQKREMQLKEDKLKMDREAKQADIEIERERIRSSDRQTAARIGADMSGKGEERGQRARLEGIRIAADVMKAMNQTQTQVKVAETSAAAQKASAKANKGKTNGD